MKRLTPLAVVLLLAGCASTSTDTATPAATATVAKPAAVAAKESAPTNNAATKTGFMINSVSGFADNAQVPTNVREECHGVTIKLTNAVVKYGSNQGLKVMANPDVTPEQSGKVVKVSITGMYSAGNAFIGHRKSASVKAELYQDGKLLDSTDYTRDSNGGFFGGFKGSCAVLEHTVNTLGNDVAKWLKQKHS